jgi:riboflavin kinase/FMN adenylyltransferase
VERGAALVVSPDEPALLPAVVNIGRRPTFDAGDRILAETHILDRDEDLYGKLLEVRLLGRLRDERRFSGPLDLVEQIRRDIEARRRFLEA